jgi:hypothetical protein
LPSNAKKNRIFSPKMNIFLNIKEDFAPGPILVS